MQTHYCLDAYNINEGGGLFFFSLYMEIVLFMFALVFTVPMHLNEVDEQIIPHISASFHEKVTVVRQSDSS